MMENNMLHEAVSVSEDTEDLTVDYNWNFTYNYSYNFYYDYDPSRYAVSREISNYLSMVGIPVLILLGITGSSLSLLVFSSTKLRKQSCTVYLAYLNIVDFGFLCSLIPPWLSWVGVEIFYQNGWCQATVFSSSIFSFLSVWVVVCFTVERYIVVYYPFQKTVMCTRQRALTVIICLTVATFIAYSYLLFTIGIQQFGDTSMSVCVPYPQHMLAVHYLTTVDTFFTMIIPFISIAILNTAIIVKLFKMCDSSHRNVLTITYSSSSNHEHTSNTQRSSFQMNEPDEQETVHWDKTNSTPLTPLWNNNNHHQQRSGSPEPGRITTSCGRRRNQNQIKTTRSLVLISSFFVLLNSPSHMFKLYFIFSQIMGSTPKHTPLIHITQECTQFLYYINFAANMLQYVAFSQSFRESLISLIKKLRQKCRC